MKSKGEPGLWRSLWKRAPGEVTDPVERTAYGKLAGIVGVGANLILFIVKMLAGLFTGSVSIMADAFNNLSDAGSSIVTLVGFRMAAAPPDKEHPFGHGRMEYVAALVVSVMILLAGFELARSSLGKAFHPEDTAFGMMPLLILLAAIAVKLALAMFYRRVGRVIDSEALAASMTDSRNDMLCTALVLLSAVVEWKTGWHIDGWVGTAVALFVLWSGVAVMRETVSPLLGQAPDPAMVQNIRHTVLAHEGIVGVHDLMVHNYGPGRYSISLHAEVPCHEDMMRSHDRIDRVEKDLSEKYNAVVCIHMDPVDTDDLRIQALRKFVQEKLHEIDPALTLHDFRVVFGETHTNLIFDLVAPYRYRGMKEIPDRLQQKVWESDPHLFVVPTVEHSYAEGD